MTKSEIMEQISQNSKLKAEIDTKRIRLSIAIGNLSTYKSQADNHKASANTKHTCLGGFTGTNADSYSELVTSMMDGVSKYSDNVGIVIEDFKTKLAELLKQSNMYQDIIDSLVSMLEFATD